MKRSRFSEEQIIGILKRRAVDWAMKEKSHSQRRACAPARAARIRQSRVDVVLM